MGKIDAFLFDVDGTLALMNGRSPYDTTRYCEDLPNEAILKVANILASVGYAIIITSGREEKHREVTARWLSRFLDHLPQALLMRPNGTIATKDADIKEQMYREQIEPFYNVIAVFDDRDRVVAKWREIGLTCLQVAPGNF